MSDTDSSPDFELHAGKNVVKKTKSKSTSRPRPKSKSKRRPKQPKPIIITQQPNQPPYMKQPHQMQPPIIIPLPPSNDDNCGGGCGNNNNNCMPPPMQMCCPPPPPPPWGMPPPPPPPWGMPPPPLPPPLPRRRRRLPHLPPPPQHCPPGMVRHPNGSCIFPPRCSRVPLRPGEGILTSPHCPPGQYKRSMWNFNNAGIPVRVGSKCTRFLPGQCRSGYPPPPPMPRPRPRPPPPPPKRCGHKGKHSHHGKPCGGSRGVRGYSKGRKGGHSRGGRKGGARRGGARRGGARRRSDIVEPFEYGELPKESTVFNYKFLSIIVVILIIALITWMVRRQDSY